MGVIERTDEHGNPLGTIYLFRFDGGSEEYEFVSAGSYRRQTEKLVTALEFYADESVYTPNHDDNDCLLPPAVNDDRGVIARAALDEAQEDE